MAARDGNDSTGNKKKADKGIFKTLEISKISLQMDWKDLFLMSVDQFILHALLTFTILSLVKVKWCI